MRMTTKHRGTNRKNGIAELRSAAADVGHDVRELAATAGDVALRQLDPVEAYIKGNPMRSMLMAAGVGVVFGYLFGRR